ncbi:DUF1576 domain-containing protein [Dethiothermospora halolimnae]|uniref:DUF1576 domain-containing protein n=1 Tax=Dethiothermospora halolimnae TaxID=3114390 RepID=UPI003CCB88D4
MENKTLGKYNDDYEKKKVLILLILPILLSITAFIVDTPKEIFNGMYKIIVHPDILLTDYLKVGGLGATFINSAILTFINIFILWKFDIKVSGLSIAAVYIVTGFAFFGKNVFNVWPIYIGGLLYAKYQDRKFKSIVLISMFGTALSPLVNEIAYGLNLPFPLSLVLGILIGILVGFILPPLSAHFLKTHDGYGLYNVGFTAGFIGTVITALLRGYGLLIESHVILSTDYDLFLKLFLTLYFLILIIIGVILNNKGYKGYKEILEYEGRLVTDFTRLVSFEISLINMGIMGLVGMIYVIISNGTLNGPILGGLLTVVGFGAFGKHPKNTIPILLGIFLASFTTIWPFSSTGVILAGLFGTALAPIVGEYGWYYGIIIGFLHLSVVMNVGYLHGGINLYNNGFSTGIIASVLVPIIDAFKKGD